MVLCKYMRLQGREFTREKVRKRDGYTCQECKRTWVEGRKFDVHHIVPIEKGQKGSKRYDRVEEIENLITLCQ